MPTEELRPGGAAVTEFPWGVAPASLKPSASTGATRSRRGRLCWRCPWNRTVSVTISESIGRRKPTASVYSTTTVSSVQKSAFRTAEQAWSNCWSGSPATASNPPSPPSPSRRPAAPWSKPWWNGTTPSSPSTPNNWPTFGTATPVPEPKTTTAMPGSPLLPYAPMRRPSNGSPSMRRN